MSTLLIIVAILLVISFNARVATYVISSYPAGPAEVPCDAFKKNPDGSWTQVAILIAGGALIPAGNDFKNTAETRIIEKKCDKKQRLTTCLLSTSRADQQSSRYSLVAALVAPGRAARALA